MITSWFTNMFQGFCMAMADSVPGVSGGSIAFLMGFYDQFIGSLNALSGKNHKKRKEALPFLAKLGAGWVIGMGLAVTILAVVFEKYIYVISSLFMGFILVAIIVMIKNNRDRIKINTASVLCFAGGCILVVLVTLLNHSGSAVMDLSNLTVFNGIYLFFAAMIAISAMVLPGISGSTLLLVFGLYMPVISAIKSLMHLDFSVLPALCIFGMGVLTGILLFVRLIKMALEKFPGQTMCGIIGLMVGSFYSIMMGPTTLKVPQEAMSFSTFHIIAFIVGALLVLLMEKGSQINDNKKEISAV
ncbi:MAG: DUF368 domain-containing protein [Hespellia sp.]|nr:DUF368 domain-containing protein [Hespellia sp.]